MRRRRGDGEALGLLRSPRPSPKYAELIGQPPHFETGESWRAMIGITKHAIERYRKRFNIDDSVTTIAIRERLQEIFAGSLRVESMPEQWRRDKLAIHGMENQWYVNKSEGAVLVAGRAKHGKGFEFAILTVINEQSWDVRQGVFEVVERGGKQFVKLVSPLEIKQREAAERRQKKRADGLRRHAEKVAADAARKAEQKREKQAAFMRQKGWRV